MRRAARHLPPAVCAALAAAALGLAACGGNDDTATDGTTITDPTTPAGDPRVLREQDAEAQSNARGTQTQVLECFRKARDYAKCDESQEIENASELSLPPYGSDMEQVEVTQATGTSYTITAHSASGNDFTIKDGERTCTRPGVGACKADGTWAELD